MPSASPRTASASRTAASPCYARSSPSIRKRPCGPERPLSCIPSNRLLQARANGMPEATLRRHLAALVAAGILLRRDSPNGKRYVREGGEGRETYGFDLSLLIARAGEFEALRDGRRSRRPRTPAASRSRHDPSPRIARDRDRGGCGRPSGGLEGTAAALQDLCARRADRLPADAPRRPRRRLAGSWRLPRTPSLPRRSKRASQNTNANAAQNWRHLSESNPQPKDLEPRFQEVRGQPPRSDLQRQGEGIGGSGELSSASQLDISPAGEGAGPRSRWARTLRAGTRAKSSAAAGRARRRDVPDDPRLRPPRRRGHRRRTRRRCRDRPLGPRHFAQRLRRGQGGDGQL